MVQVLVALLSPSDTLDDFLDTLSIRHGSSPTLAQLVCNFATIAKRPDIHELVIPQGLCPCLTGPYAAYVDKGLGHVHTMDLSILSSDSALLALSPGGNFHVAPLSSTYQHQQAFRSLWTQVVDLLADLPCYDSVLDDDSCFDRFWDMVTVQLPRRDYRALQYQLPHVHTLSHAHEHLMLTCIDKVPSHLAAVCIHWAATQIVTHLDSPCYSVTDVHHELTDYNRDLTALLTQLELSVDIPISAPYIYPTIKAHKCAQHDPNTPHECGIVARKITADVSSYHTWLGHLTSAILGSVKHAILEHRYTMQQSFEDQYGFTLRFYYWIDAWQSMPLNLPDTVGSELRLINCDVKQRFDDIPLDGPDGLLQVITHPVHEAYDYTQRDIYVAIDHDDLVIPKRHKFAANYPWTPPGGKVKRWLCIPRALALTITHLYLTSLFVMVGPTLARQVLGIPMGGSPSSHCLDLYLDHYEYRWARSVASIAAQTPAIAYRFAQAMLYFFRYADDTMGIVPPWFITLVTPTAQRDQASPQWIYPLLSRDGTTILEFDIEGALTLSINFLCLTITLGSVKLRHGRTQTYRQLTYKPYSKAIKFQFGIHRLTHWYSFTTRSIQLAAFKTLMAYAILGSTQVTDSIEYLCTVCDVLRDNCYPRDVIARMWVQAESHLYSTPCRKTLSTQLPEVALAVQAYIAIMDF